MEGEVSDEIRGRLLETFTGTKSLTVVVKTNEFVEEE